MLMFALKWVRNGAKRAPWRKRADESVFPRAVNPSYVVQALVARNWICGQPGCGRLITDDLSQKSDFKRYFMNFPAAKTC